MRVKPEVRAEHRRALLEAAARSFATDGFDRAGIDAISVQAGLAKGTVYNHFPSKRAIFEAVLREACALAAGSAEAVPEHAGTDERLEAFVAGNVAWARERPELAVLVAREMLGGSAETRRLIVEASAPCIEKVATVLERARREGELSAEGSPADLALGFIMLANGLLLQATATNWPSVERLAETSARLFLHGAAGAAGA
ncbi:MAG TPA: TetR/AcrR family transcriptional regulator [Solirubrobacteraceae bacterium]|nr:TetR/AcrR family transcriptional regulator [Solirubrobacteraceae bacterium]